METMVRPSASQQSMASALLRTGLLVFIVDGLFASATGLFIPPVVSPLRVFQGVASVLMGKDALTGGVSTGAIGLLMHLGVAFFWSGLFVLALRSSPALRSAIQSWPKALIVASVYGMSIWLIMTLLVIPSLVHHGPNPSPKYWVQLIGHIPFVAGTMVLANRG